MIDLYVLFMSRVPRPNTLLVFGLTTLTAFTLLAPYNQMMLQADLYLPVLCIVLGYTLVALRNLPTTVRRLREIDGDETVILSILFPFALCAAGLFSPSLAWAQHGISVLIAVYTLLFASLTLRPKDLSTVSWFGRSWTVGQRNAANWHIARLLALILGNELVIRGGTTTDWMIAVSIGPIVLHYMMYWTVFATHPYDDDGEFD